MAPAPGPARGGGSTGAEPRGVDQVVLRQDAHGRRPFDRREPLVEWAPHGVVVREETRRFAGAQEEMREGVGAILERTDLTRGCGNRHDGIITRASTDRTEDA